MILEYENRNMVYYSKGRARTLGTKSLVSPLMNLKTEENAEYLSSQLIIVPEFLIMMHKLQFCGVWKYGILLIIFLNQYYLL